MLPPLERRRADLSCVAACAFDDGSALFPVASGSTRMAVVLLVWIHNNMTSIPELTASLIVHKQAELTRQYSRLRSYSFSATVADRFFSDNSLDRQKRVVDCTKRRQARAQEKARLQSEQLHQLQEQYERKAQERVRRDARESLRLTRKLEHVAAAYIHEAFAHYEELAMTMRHDSITVIPADEERQQTQQALAHAVLVGKQMTSMEALLLKQVDELEARLKEATKRQNDENERLRRLRRWLELRHSKEDDHLRAQLEEWEARKRHEIRMEVERAVEIERRARLRDKQTPLKRMTDGALISM
ncbi:hypothetical protein Poli38472_006421 [Pythium oligandrum]|uniref:Uncharacterized protein n=1 Tax=Pythium oligandrum TaxID=41045 RepID=A0A8K1C4R7_PYTOL|nr:hypothetical protein Poli38472_006421 [Pythium oligandrum]|eukprot:TMW56411.1 hypothetical protein Poli38472_006421 [Pythium oligandrum]